MKRTHIAFLAAVAALGLSLSPLAARAAQDKTVDHAAHAAAEGAKADNANQGMMNMDKKTDKPGMMGTMEKKCPACDKKMEGHDPKAHDMSKMDNTDGKDTKAHDMSKMGDAPKSE